MGLLKQKAVLITGAGSGVGREAALACAREGARVAVVDLDADSGEETVRLIQATDAESVFFRADVSQADEMEAAVRRTVAAFGRLDCAFNNAGIVLDEQVPLADYEEAAWNKTLAVNLSAVWLGMKCEIPPCSAPVAV
jgi:NAD(P)-dependent dehydrogenase (short-subunit alcohol dehydrogenase family)